MSASTIAASRHGRHQDKRIAAIGDYFQNEYDRDRRKLQPATVGTQSVRLRKALMSTVDVIHLDGLALPTSSTFEALDPVPIQLALTGPATTSFASHTAFNVPREGHAPGQQVYDQVHCFIVKEPSALNAGLTAWALQREAKATAARHDILHRQGNARQAIDLGVVRSNRGGYQSQPDLFEKPKAPRNLAAVDAQEESGARHLRELHAIASDAVSACGRAPLCTPHAACAWLNVNRNDDVNKLHIHATFMSATYYVNDGQTLGPETGSMHGCLVFRGGASSKVDEASPLQASHSFMSVRPEPGSLWVFPGSVPHAVMGMDDEAEGVVPIVSTQFRYMNAMDQRKVNEHRDGERAQWTPRISIAMNFQ